MYTLHVNKSTQDVLITLETKFDEYLELLTANIFVC
jgi:hypothetical protein